MSTDVELLISVLRAEANGTDLKVDMGGHRVYVCCEDKEGRSRVMGWVDRHIMYEDPEAFHMMVGRIKFSERRHDDEQ